MTAPRTIDRYRLRRRLGSGAFASVYTAIDEVLDAAVALKLLAAEWSADAEVRERFLQEARLLHRVDHPALVRVHDVGQLADGRPWFTMTLADRGTLAARLEDRGGLGRARPGDVRAVVDVLAEGLDALHAAGVVHRDVSPRNLLLTRPTGAMSGRSPRAGGDRALLDDDERLLLADLGLAKDLRGGSDGLTVLGGTPRYQAPEQTTPLAAIDARTDGYAATCVVWEVVTGSLPPVPHELRRRLSELSEPWRRFMARGMAGDPGERFGDMGAWRDAIEPLLDLRVPVVAPAPGPGIDNPYPGLAPYTADRAGYYSGREELLDALVARLSQEPALAVAGSSGAGKSSLLSAGLVPLVEQGALGGDHAWRPVLLRPGPAPLQRLVDALRTAGVTTPSPDEVRADPTGALASIEPDGGVVVVVDQLEELIALAPRDTDQAAFVAALEALASAGPTTRVVVAVRPDFYGQLSAHRWLGQLFRRHLYVGPMQRAELRRAVERPALRAGVLVDGDLVDAVLEEAAGEPGALPHVSHALAETWRRRSGDRLTLEDYRAVGGVSGALAESAGSLHRSLDDRERSLLRGVLAALVAPGSTDRPATRGSIELAHLDAPRRRLVDRLADARLVVIEDGVAQLAHDTLLTSWDELRTVIDDARGDLRTADELRRAGAAWAEREHDPDLLQRGAVLRRTEEWLGRVDPPLTPVEREFVTAARARQRRNERARRITVGALVVLVVVAAVAAVAAQRQSDRAEAATQLAHSRRLAAESSASLLRADRPLAALLAAAGNDLAPTVESRTAMLQSIVADIGSSTSLSGHVGEVRSVVTGPGGTVISTGVDGTVRVWPAQGDPVVLDGHDQEVRDAAPIGVGDQVVSVGLDGTVRRWDVATGTELDRWIPEGSGTADDVASAPGGGGQSASGSDGGSRPSDVASAPGGGGQSASGSDGGFRGSGGAGGGGGSGAGGGEQGGPRTVEPPGGGAPQGGGSSGGGQGAVGGGGSAGLRSVSVTSDGNRVAVGGRGGVWTWRLDRPAEPALLAPWPSEVRAVAWRPDGAQLAIADRDGAVVVLDRDGAEVARLPEPHQDAVMGVAWSPDGTRLYSTGRDRRLRAWHVAGDEVVTVAGAHDSEVYAVAVSADGGRVATAGADRVARIWAADGLQPLDALAGHQNDVRDVAFDDGGAVVTAGNDGTVRRWDSGRGAAVTVLSGAGDGLLDLAGDPALETVVGASRDGEVLWWFPTSGSDRAVRVAAHEGPVNAVALLADGRAATVGTDGRLVVSDRDGASQELHRSEQPLLSIAVDQDTGRLAIGGASGSVWVGEPGAGTPFVEVGRHESAVFALTWEPGGRRVLSGDRTGVLRWSTAEEGGGGGGDTILDELGYEVRAVAIRPDGALAVVAGADATIRRYDLDGGGAALDPLVGHGSDVRDLTFVANGGLLVSVGRDRVVRWWDGRTGAVLASGEVHAADNRAVVASADGTRVVTAANDGEVIAWPGPPRWRSTVCGVAGRDLTTAEWQRHAGSDVSRREVCSG